MHLNYEAYVDASKQQARSLISHLGIPRNDTSGAPLEILYNTCNR